MHVANFGVPFHSVHDRSIGWYHVFQESRRGNPRWHPSWADDAALFMTLSGGAGTKTPPSSSHTLDRILSSGEAPTRWICSNVGDRADVPLP